MAVESWVELNVQPEGAHIPVFPFPIVTTGPGLGEWAISVFQFNKAGSGSATLVLPTTAGVNIGPCELDLPDNVDCCAHAVAPATAINMANLMTV
jgi:hypothetical protein